MSLAKQIARMIAAGVSPEDAGAIAAEIYAAGVASASVRSAGAERTRRWRENRASQCDGFRHAVTPSDTNGEASPNVTYRHQASQCDASTVLHRENNKKESSRQNSVRASRGTRIDPSWSPSAADRLVGRQEGFSDTEIDREAARFRDYWASRAGAGGVKLDWAATWRNWIRTSAEKLGKTPAVTSGTASAPVGFYAKFGSEEQDAWDAYGKAKKGKTFPRDAKGGWSFPTQWPPGYQPKGSGVVAPDIPRLRSMQ